jgi:ATP-dependent DNA helicase RecQ
MCRKQPLSREAFLGVSGAGEVKLEKYGAAFMEAIKKHGEQAAVSSPAPVKPGVRVFPTLP